MPPSTQNTAAIDIVLPPGSAISGNIKDASTNAPIGNATVYFFNSSGTLVGHGTSDGPGNYSSAAGLTAGMYYAATANGSARGAGNGYVNALYSGKNCLLACTVNSGTVITAGTSNVNFSLSKGLDFAGVVTGPGASAQAGVTIQIDDSSGILAASIVTDSLGRYAADGLPAGTYYARSVNNLGLLDTLYGGAACAGNCNVLSGTPIVISNTNQPQNINFNLTADRIFRNGFD